VFHRVECLELDLLMLYILERERKTDGAGKRRRSEEGCKREVEYRYNQVDSLYFYIMYAFTSRIHD